MINNENKIIISKPYIEERENGLYRLCANIAFEGADHLVFVEVEKEYKEFLVTECADSFVFLTLPIALREGYDIHCETPITPMFLHNIQTILLPALTQGDSRAHNIDIVAPHEDVKIESANGVGASVSCGVDSTYTIMNYTQDKYPGMDLTHLLVGSVSSDLWDFSDDDNLITWEQKHASRFQRYNIVSEYTGLPIVKVFTNFAPFIIKRRNINEWYRHVHLHTFITLGMVLSIKKLFGTYIYSSAYDYSHFSLKDNLTTDPADYELLLMHVLSTPNFMCFSGGATVDRIEKTIALTEYPLAQKVLHPCFRDTPTNCSTPTCSKCMRGLFALDYYDKLDLMSEVFDVERYRKNRNEYLISLIKSKESPNFQLLHEMFWEKYPKDMENAQKTYEKRSASVSRSEYNYLVRAYDTMLLLVSQDEPKQAITNFFKEKNIKKLYYSGESRFGKKIIDLLDETIEVVTYKTGSINECDAIFIGAMRDNQIEKIKEELNKKLDKEMSMYTILEIKKALTVYYQ